MIKYMTNDFTRYEVEEKLKDAYSKEWTMRDASRLREILRQWNARDAEKKRPFMQNFAAIAL